MAMLKISNMMSYCNDIKKETKKKVLAKQKLDLSYIPFLASIASIALVTESSITSSQDIWKISSQ